MKKTQKTIILSIILSMLLGACADSRTTHPTEQETQSIETDDTIYDGLIENPKPLEKQNAYDVLNVATYITKAEDTYFIADCYHDQILYSDALTKPLTEWKELTDEVHYAHTIASDGTTLLIDDTENNRLLAFQRTDAGYVHTQTLDEIGLKPHFVQYDEKERMFLAWSSITGELYLIKKYDKPNEQGIYPLYIEGIAKIDELYGVYVRSFTIIGGELYFVSGHNNQKIIKAKIVRDGKEFTLAVIDRYDVPAELAGMVQLYPIQDYYYITISTDNAENQDYATIIRTKRLEDLMTGKYEDIYSEFGLSGGTPYYINEIEGRYYMTHHRTSENIIAFDVTDNVIQNVEVLY